MSSTDLATGISHVLASFAQSECLAPRRIKLSVSLAEGGKASLDQGCPHFSAVLDTGHTHNFVDARQLVRNHEPVLALPRDP